MTNKKLIILNGIKIKEINIKDLQN